MALTTYGRRRFQSTTSIILVRNSAVCQQEKLITSTISIFREGKQREHKTGKKVKY